MIIGMPVYDGVDLLDVAGRPCCSDAGESGF
jgi:hypothetical protein